MTIRILQIIPTLVRGGAEKQLALLATGLPRDRFDVHVCVLTHTGPLEEKLREAEIPLSFIDKRWKIDPFAYWRLRKEIKRLQPDIVQTWLFAANAYGRQAAISCDIKHILASERCVDPWKGKVQLSIDRVLAKRTERIITNSTGVQEFYAEQGLPIEKFVVIPNGIRPFTPTATMPREALLAQLKLPPETRLIGAIGRLWPQKRVKDLIWATDLLQCIRDDVHMLVIGDGPQRWRLERYARQANVVNKVHFLGERNDVPQLLPHLDLLWLASGYEGQSNAILEGMSAGLPIVASDIPGNRDLVVHEETGFLVDVGDRGTFAQRAQQLLEDRDLAHKLGAAGRQRVLDQFSVEQMVGRHAALYEQIVD
ncbi:Putative glycosyltransferase EpsD [Anatilimnocola aggregata]|uniref:Glycosyltransferase EpsD n=1 Tax=Anatilimnocola aggregata TaxID=2528021 RepID=A0A517YN02_9BACT|nr:glycosyltransferase [Anatilimnocola aggregata]QDU31592.1 Putative glycosyltransferase EpsD [Anatilimnocola aggregata]